LGKCYKPHATVAGGHRDRRPLPRVERLLLQPVNQLFPGNSALLENPEKRPFGKVVVERDDGTAGSLLGADVAAFLPDYLKTVFFEE